MKVAMFLIFLLLLGIGACTYEQVQIEKTEVENNTIEQIIDDQLIEEKFVEIGEMI